MLLWTTTTAATRWAATRCTKRSCYTRMLGNVKLIRHCEQKKSCSNREFSRRLSSASSASSPLANFDLSAEDCNVTSNIAGRVGKGLHRTQNHPLHTIKESIAAYFNRDDDTTTSYTLYDDLDPVVSVASNFDLLRIPPDHVSRSYSDTYYLNADTLLRCHTSAHQVALLSDKSNNQFLVAGDVYRRDEIDKSHYPVFHQMEGVRIFDSNVLNSNCSSPAQAQEMIRSDLQQQLEGLARHLFGDVEMRWVDAYFPFTDPSMELEIFFEGEWLEVLGCGVIHPDILTNAGRDPTQEQGWAFGLGLERLAMVLFGIPDIRLFWSEDSRFHDQFASGKIVKFEPYSKYPPCYKDVSFWLPEDHSSFHVNDLNELVRDIAGDLVEQVELLDDFTHPKTNRASHCYRIAYRSMDRSLTNEEIDALQELVRERTEKDLGVELR